MDDLISRQAVLEMAYDMSEIDGEHFTEPCMVVDVEDIQKLPPVTQKSETVTEFADRCRECGAKYGKLLKQEPKTEQFAKWVASEIFDEWEYNKDTFAEIACRKLEKLGIVRAKGDEWELVEPQESEG